MDMGLEVCDPVTSYGTIGLRKIGCRLARTILYSHLASFSTQLASLRTRHARRPLRSSSYRVVTRFGRPEVRAAARLRLCRAARLHPSLVCAVCGRGFVKQRPILTPLIAPHLAKARGYLVDARIERAHLGV